MMTLLLSWASLATDTTAAVVSRGSGGGVCLVTCPVPSGRKGPLLATIPPVASRNPRAEGLRSPWPAPPPPDGKTDPEKGQGWSKITESLGTEPRCDTTACEGYVGGQMARRTNRVESAVWASETRSSHLHVL